MCAVGQRLMIITVLPNGEIIHSMSKFSMPIIHFCNSKISIDRSDAFYSSPQCISPTHPPNFAWVYEMGF